MESCTKGRAARAAWTRCVCACRDRVLALCVVLVAQAVLAVGCGASDEPAAPAAAPPKPVAPQSAARPELQLPVVGTAGRVPVGESVVRVVVDGDGRISVDGEGPLSLDGLHRVLWQRTRDAGWREDDGSSKLLLLIDADGRVPWVVPLWVVRVAAMPATKMRRCLLGVEVRGAGAGGESARGALACYQPGDPYVIHANRQRPSPRLAVTLSMHDGEASDPAEILAALRACMAEAPDEAAWFELAVGESDGAAVPTAFAVEVLALARAAGASELVLHGSALPSPFAHAAPGLATFDPADVDALLAYVARLKALAARPRVEVPDPPAGSGKQSGRRPDDMGRLDGLYGGGVVAGEAEPNHAKSPQEENSWLAERRAEEEEAIRRRDEKLDEDIDGVLPRSIPRGFQRRQGLRREASFDPVEAALGWLAAHQLPSGAWSSEAAPEGDVRSTGLALVAFTNAGYTRDRDHAYASTVRRGIAWLVAQHDGQGFIGMHAAPEGLLGHAAAAWAVVMACRQTSDEALRSLAASVLRYALAWHEGPAAQQADVTTKLSMALPVVAAWGSLRASREAGKPVPLVSEERIEAIVRGILERMGAPADDVGTASRAWFLGLLRDPAHASELESLRAKLVEKARAYGSWKRAPDPTIWWVFAMALAQGGNETQAAYRLRMQPHAVDSQVPGLDATDVAGSWEPSGESQPALDRTQTTALMALALDVSYHQVHAFGAR